MNLFIKCLRVASQTDRLEVAVIRVGLIVVLLWIGGLKAFKYEADGIIPFVATSPFMSFLRNDPSSYQAHKNPEGALVPANRAWHEQNGTYRFAYGLGAVIVLYGLMLCLHPWLPQVAALGSFLVLIMSVVTLSFLITTPECWVPPLGDVNHGFPFLERRGAFGDQGRRHDGRGAGHNVGFGECLSSHTKAIMSQIVSYQVIVLGGGKGGKTLAIELGQKGVKTALIERSAEMIGGSCINVACIPTKTLIASARVAQAARRAGDFGIRTGDIAVDWPAVRRRAEGVVSAMRAMNHKNFTSAPALDFILGSGRFVGSRVIEMRDSKGDVRQLTAEKIFINTGTRPAQPNIPGLGEVGALNSETIQHLDELPDHLVVLGGSYVSLEFAQMFRHFGSKVTVLERAPQLLKKEDADVVEALGGVLREEGIEIQLNCSVERVEKEGKGIAVVLTTNGKSIRVSGSHLLVALGRSPNTEELNLTAAGVEMDKRGFVKVNERLETTAKGTWALGDVNGGPQFTHASLDDYRIVKANVFDGGRRTTTDRLIPFTLFTEPELARVGLTENEARQQGLEIRIAKLPVAAIPRAKTISETRGFIKAVIDGKTSRILGCAILSIEAGEMLGTVQMAMIAGLPFTALRDAVLSHPTMVEGFNNLPSNPY